VQNAALPSVSNDNSKKQENFTGCNGMLSVHILYVIQVWKRRSLRSLKDSLPSVSDNLQLGQVPPFFCTPYITRTAVVSLSHSVFARVSTTQCTCKTWSVNGFFNSQPKNPMFMTKVLFMDKSHFTRTGITNIHKEHVWPDENLHVIPSPH
jgi:hypothetical protein